jgi:hypothetical protein
VVDNTDLRTGRDYRKARAPGEGQQDPPIGEAVQGLPARSLPIW